MKTVKTIAISTFSATVLLGAAQTWAAGEHGGGHGAKSPIGTAGKAVSATRTININLSRIHISEPTRRRRIS